MHLHPRSCSGSRGQPPALLKYPNLSWCCRLSSMTSTLRTHLFLRTWWGCLAAGWSPIVCGLPSSSSSSCLRRMGGWCRLQHRPRSRSIFLVFGSFHLRCMSMKLLGLISKPDSANFCLSPPMLKPTNVYNFSSCRKSLRRLGLQGGDTYWRLVFFWRFSFPAFLFTSDNPWGRCLYSISHGWM